MADVNASIEERVKRIIVDQLDVNEDQVTLDASFLDDLGARLTLLSLLWHLKKNLKMN